MASASEQSIIDRIKSGDLIPYLGPGVLEGVTNTETGEPIPATGESLILELNNGQPMAPRLMYEFPRAAMNIELKKGRKYIEKFLTELYGEKSWSDSSFHKWLFDIGAPYIIDTNRDSQLQDLYKSTPHTLVVGLARVAGTDYRYEIYHYSGESYTEVTADKVDSTLPILFKPLGCANPKPTFIASDADYVDYITELMGGFAIPPFIKSLRKGKQYLIIGMRFQRDTERMILSDMIYDADSDAGTIILPEPSAKEVKFCKKKNLQIIEANWKDILAA